MTDPSPESLTAAQALVEHFLGRPLGRTTATEVVDLRGGLALLPRTPLVDVLSVMIGDEDKVDAASWSAFGMVYVGAALSGWQAAEITSTGGPDPEYPDVVGIVDAVARRLDAGIPAAAGGVKQESVGAYSVKYDEQVSTVAAEGLTGSERAAIWRYRVRTEAV